MGRAGFGGTDELRGLRLTIARSHWGQGYATEIAGALLDWHRHNAPGIPLRALVAVGNDASARVCSKAELIEVGAEDFAGVPCRVFVP